jgi:hypothetical protein
MHLSDEKARRLSSLIWRDRIRRWLPVVAGVLALAGVLGFVMANQMGRADRTVAVQEHDGTVISIKRANSARGASILAIHLDDGRDVEAFTALRVLPAAGSHVVIAEARHASGRSTYDVLRLADH